MEEEEEIQSHASPESESHSPPSGSAGVTVVTVAAAAPSSIPIPSTSLAITTTSLSTTPPSSSTQSNLTLGLPIRPATVGGGGREDCWSEGATSVLINAWGERYMELSRGNLKQKHWKEVADIVSSREDYTKTPKTDIQCKNRIDTVKKKYKIEKAKVASGNGPSLWPFFDRLDRLIGPSAAASAAKVVPPGTASQQKAVPVGIPVGIRPLPLPGLPHYLQTPPHLQHHHHQQQQQQFRPNNNNSFSPSPPLFHKLSNTTTNNNNNVSNLSNSIRQQQQQQLHLRRGMVAPMPPADSESDQEEGWSADSGDSLPPETTFERRKQARVELCRNISGAGGLNRGKQKGNKKGKKEKGMIMGSWGNSVRDLTRAIMKFGEAYEAAESAKLQQIVEMEKQRMKFAKELELQRMKFLMKTQLELSQLNGNVGNNDNNNNNNSDSRGGGTGERGGGESNHLHLHENHHLNNANSESNI